MLSEIGAKIMYWISKTFYLNQIVPSIYLSPSLFSEVRYVS
ncbi:hypothetical protein LPICM02_340179 [Pseudolactococcus piscium]|nr:hypothetical protein LPICM02_340179 [Lactococcus piscium]